MAETLEDLLVWTKAKALCTELCKMLSSFIGYLYRCNTTAFVKADWDCDGDGDSRL